MLNVCEATRDHLESTVADIVTFIFISLHDQSDTRLEFIVILTFNNGTFV